MRLSLIHCHHLMPTLPDASAEQPVQAMPEAPINDPMN